MHEIKPGQVYESCDPREATRLTIAGYTPGDTRAHVTDTAGKRPRWIRVTDLHPTGTTRTGEPRRRGYRLIHDTP